MLCPSIIAQLLSLRSISKVRLCFCFTLVSQVGVKNDLLCCHLIFDEIIGVPRLTGNSTLG